MNDYDSGVLRNSDFYGKNIYINVKVYREKMYGKQ